jgi:hypothetical protein
MCIKVASLRMNLHLVYRRLSSCCHKVYVHSNVQGDRKVTQHILKYLLMVAIQYNPTGLINQQYRCDYTRAHADHVML